MARVKVGKQRFETNQPWRYAKPEQPDWQRMRATHLLTYPECRACGTRDNVVVHHIRYRGKRGTKEQPGDLMTLCKTHHDEYHALYGTKGLIANSLAYVERIAQETLMAAGH